MTGQVQISVPRKTRELSDFFMDSTRWNDFKFRNDDIVIATYSKSGTTWVQQIVAQLLFDGQDMPVGALSPWVELRLVPKAVTHSLLESQTHRRFVKTHLPIDALVFSPLARYIYVGRDGRDVLWSLHKFAMGFGKPSPEILKASMASGAPPPAETNPDIRRFYHEWLDRDGYPVGPFFASVQGWYDTRQLSNVLLVHFNALKRDMLGEINRIAHFLGIEVRAAAWPRIIEHCSFDYMKRNAVAVAPAPAANLLEGISAFFHQGVNDRWRDVLNPAEVKKYEDLAARKLTADCAHWLQTGDLPRSAS